MRVECPQINERCIEASLELEIILISLETKMNIVLDL